jgi:hypothetical protein
MSEQATTRRKRTLSAWLVPLVVVGLVATIAGLWAARSESDSPADIEPKRFNVVVLSDTKHETTRLKSGAQFFVRYDVKDPADAKRLSLGANLGLRRDGKVTHDLITRLGDDHPPIVQAPSEPVYNVGFESPGPYEFRLPKLEAGHYQLCGHISFRVGNEVVGRDGERFCKTIEVVS